MTEQSGKTNSTQERPAGQTSEKNCQIGQKQLVWHMDTMIPWYLGRSQRVESLCCLGFGWEQQRGYWAISAYILKVEPTRLADVLNVGFERKEGW